MYFSAVVTFYTHHNATCTVILNAAHTVLKVVRTRDPPKVSFGPCYVYDTIRQTNTETGRVDVLTVVCRGPDVTKSQRVIGRRCPSEEDFFIYYFFHFTHSKNVSPSGLEICSYSRMSSLMHRRQPNNVRTTWSPRPPSSPLPRPVSCGQVDSYFIKPYTWYTYVCTTIVRVNARRGKYYNTNTCVSVTYIHI